VILASILDNVWFQNAIYVAVGLAALAAFWIAARTIRDAVGRWLVSHHVGGDAVVLGRRVVYVTLMIVGILVALGFAFRSGNVTIAGLVAATIVASLGVQDVIRNYVSGYYVLLEHHLRVGDTIVIGTQSGVIEDIRLRVTILRGEKGSMIVVPNTELFNSVVAVRAQAQRAERAGRAARASGKGAQDDPAEGVEPIVP
jgi:small-conductance mechanosensitive channel